MQEFIDEIHKLKTEITQLMDSNGYSIDIDGELHMREDSLKDEFIENIKLNKYTFDEIKIIASEIEELSKLDYLRYYC